MKMIDERIGKRVEIAPHYDLWMRGARTGVVRMIKHGKDGQVILAIKMDNASVRKLARIYADEVTYL